MKINVAHNCAQVSAALASAARQVPFALARALTRTAQDVRAAERKEMEQVFDRPTRYTLNALFLRPATKQRLEAEVWLKESGSRPHFLLPQIEGGARPLKRFEQRLVLHGYMKQTERAVPGAGARLDAYGNMSRGQITQILSQLRTAVVVGDNSNASNSKRSSAKRVQEAYFAAGGRTTLQIEGGTRAVMRTSGAGRTQHLPRGIYVRRNFGAWGTAIKPVLLFVNKAQYRKRFRFYETAQEVVDRRFSAQFSQSWSDALKTARFAEQGKLL